MPWTKCNRSPATPIVVPLIAVGAAFTIACNRTQPACDSAVSGRRSGTWELGIRAPDSVRRGDSVTFALVLKNVGDSAIDPQLGEGNEDFKVTRAGDSTEVWSKLHGAQILMGSMLKKTFAPGDSFRIQYRWDQVGNDRQPLRPGVYCVSADLRRQRGLDSLRTELATLRVLR